MALPPSSNPFGEYLAGTRGAYVGLVALLALLAGGAFWGGYIPASAAPTTESVLASFRDCYASSARNSCFQELASGFVGKHQEASVFAAFEANQRAPMVFESCHVFTHFMGQAAFREYDGVAEAMEHGHHVCFAGFYHGVLEGYFMAEHPEAVAAGDQDALKQDIPSICAPLKGADANRKYNECLHGLGHAFMFVTSGELPQALVLCDALEPSEASWCYSGVFMENSTSTTNPDHPSKYLKADDPLYPCTILDERYLATCYTLQSMYFAHLAGGDWTKNVAWCLEVPENHRPACFNGYGQNLAGYYTDPALIRDGCLLAPYAYVSSCIGGAVGGISAKYTDPDALVSALCEQFEGEYRRMCTEAAGRIVPNT